MTSPRKEDLAGLIERIEAGLQSLLDDLNSIARNCQGCAVCDGDPGGGHETNYHIASGAAEGISKIMEDAAALRARETTPSIKGDAA